jgi:transcriptional regulator with XRE-family HTH domain
MRLGKRLRSLRKRAGLSQAELASRMSRKASHGQSTVSLLETGAYDCTRRLALTTGK